MSFSVRTVRTAVINILTRNNTTTSSYDISSGLTTRVQSISHGNNNYPIAITDYPCIRVMPKQSANFPELIGPGARRDIELEIDIYGFTALATGRANADNENLILSENVEKCLRNYVDLSSTVGQSNIMETTWDMGSTDNAEVNMFTMKLTTRSFSQT